MYIYVVYRRLNIKSLNYMFSYLNRYIDFAITTKHINNKAISDDEEMKQTLYYISLSSSLSHIV